MIECHNIGHFGKLCNYRGLFIEAWEVNIAPLPNTPSPHGWVSNIQRLIHLKKWVGSLNRQ